MPTFNDDQQQPTQVTPDAPPSTASQVTVDWERKYNGLQGQFKSEQEKAKTYAAQITELTTQYEGQVNTLLKEKEDLLKQFNERNTTAEQLQNQYGSTAQELNALKTVLKDYTDLAPLVAKGTLRINGLEGEALTTYLNQAREDLKGLVQNNTQQTLQGASVPPPTGAQTPGMTLFEAQDRMNDALIKYGARSTQFIEAERLVNEILRRPPSNP